MAYEHYYFYFQSPNTLMQEVTNIEPGSLILSPFSLSSALTMVRAGARRSTADALHKSLRYENVDEARVYDGYAQLLSSFQVRLYLYL